MASEASALSVVRQFQSETDAIREADEPIQIRMTLFTLIAFVIAAVAFIGIVKIDRIVTSVGGKVVPSSLVSTYQALDPSIIKTIDVREGDQVISGQRLATLDPTFAAADARQYQLQIESLKAQITRDEAELSGNAPIFVSTGDPDLQRYADLQWALYDQRVAQYRAQIGSFDAKIKQAGATIAKLKRDDERYGQREAIAGKIEEMRSTLASRGIGTQLNLYISQDARLELLRTIDSTHNSLVEAIATMESIKADRKAFVQQWAATLSQDIVTSRNKLDEVEALYRKAEKKLNLVELTAHESSVVLTIAKVSIGSVLKPGDPFLILMPTSLALEAEIRIASRDIGFVRVGDACTLKIDAFNSSEHGAAQGKVLWISEGAFTTNDDGQQVEPYYRGRCSVDVTPFRRVPKTSRLIPGMTLQADINVGTRSVASYLLGTFVRGVGESMREP